MKDLDVFWSFRSPYSYLATPDMRKLREDFEVNVNLRVVLPVAIRTPETLFSDNNSHRHRYIALDWPRRARFLGISDVWPSPDPIVQNFQTLEIAEEQPYIYRLCCLGVEAQRRNRGIDFAYEVSHLLFSGIRGWNTGSHLMEATARAGLVLEELDAAIADGTHLNEIEQNQKCLDDAGHWGVPTFVYEGEPFFGQDRVDTLRWHLSNCGLKRESS